MVGLGEDDMDRIRAFANTPRYQRDPTELMPEAENGDDEEPEGDRSAEADRNESTS